MEVLKIYNKSYQDPLKLHISTFQSFGSRNDKAWNWLPRTTFHDEYIRDEEYVTSIAATTFAFHSLEAELRNLKK
ncbi:hypothetical protein JHK85_057750 [Glycine max]|nr:hypothetical protein JHK85_057750 [Glycine max]